jgi:hypothetical protein
LLVENRVGVSRRAFEIIAFTALLFGLCGGVLGLLVGVIRPDIARGLYALDGDDPPPSWSPVQAGLRTGVGLGSAWGAGIGLVLALVARFCPWLLRVRLRELMVAVALFAMVLWILMRSMKLSNGEVLP